MVFLRTFVLFAMAAGVQFMVDRQKMSFDRIAEFRKAESEAENLSTPDEKQKGKPRSWLHTGEQGAKKDIEKGHKALKTLKKKKGTKKKRVSAHVSAKARADLKKKVKQLTQKVNKNKLKKTTKKAKTRKAKKSKKPLSLVQLGSKKKTRFVDLLQTGDRVTDMRQLEKRGSRYVKKEKKKPKRKHELNKHRNKQVAKSKAKRASRSSANVFVQMGSAVKRNDLELDKKKKKKKVKDSKKKKKANKKKEEHDHERPMTPVERMKHDRMKRRGQHKKLSEHKNHQHKHLLFVQLGVHHKKMVEQKAIAKRREELKLEKERKKKRREQRKKQEEKRRKNKGRKARPRKKNKNVFVQMGSEVVKKIEKSIMGDEPSFLQKRVQHQSLKDSKKRKNKKIKTPVPEFRKRNNRIAAKKLKKIRH